MKWSLLVGKFWGTEVRLHVSLLLLIPYTLLAFRPEDLPGALRVFLLIAAIFACVALHELGHTIAARLFGIQVNSIVLWPLGGVANLSRQPNKTLPDLIISAAGPLTNLVIFAVLAVLTLVEWSVEQSRMMPGLAAFFGNTSLFAFLVSLTFANLSLALFNLIPVYPLDGGRIARGLLKLLFGEKWADRILLALSLPLALALTAAGLAMSDLVMIITGLLLVLTSATLNNRALNGITMLVLYFMDRGGYYLKQEDYDPALSAYTQAIERSPTRAGLYISRAVVLMNLLDFSSARQDIEQVLTLDPRNPIAWTLRGELLALEKQDLAALEAYNRSIEIRSNWSMAYLDRGGLYMERGDLTRAGDDFNKALELSSGSPVAALMRSMLRFKTGDLPGARADAEQALSYAPRWMLVFPELFLINLEGQLDWAVDYYTTAAQRMPNAYQVFQGRADAFRANHRPGWAVEDYTRAIQIAPRQAEIYLGRARALLLVDAPERSADDLRQAAALTGKAHIRRQALTMLDELKTGQAFSSAAATGGLTRATGQNESTGPAAGL